MRARRKAALRASYLTIASPRHPRDATENEDIIARAEVSRDPGLMPHILATSGGRLDRTVYFGKESVRPNPRVPLATLDVLRQVRNSSARDTMVVAINTTRYVKTSAHSYVSTPNILKRKSLVSKYDSAQNH